MSIGDVLKKVRVRSGLSQEEIAELLHMARSTISKVENGKMELKISDAIRWGQVTRSNEVIAALLCGIDVATIIQNISMLVGGFVVWL